MANLPPVIFLGSAPSDLLTMTIGSPSSTATHNYGGLGGTASASIMCEISSMDLGVPEGS